MENFIDINIVIFPSEEVTNTFISLSKEIAARHGTYYILNEKNVLPHLSLYSARYPKKNFPKIQKAITDIVNNTNTFELVVHSYTFFVGFLFGDIIKDSNLLRLHGAVVDVLNPLREGLITEDQLKLKGLSKAQEQSIQTYGYLSVKDTYIPHISLTALKDPGDAKVILEHLPTEDMRFNLERIAITPFAQYGTCTEVLKEFSIV
jgi:hypothetical protein